MTVLWMQILVLTSCLTCQADHTQKANQIRKRSFEVPSDLLFENELRLVKRLKDPDSLLRVKTVEQGHELHRVKRMKRGVHSIPEASSQHVEQIHHFKGRQLRDQAIKLTHELIRRNVQQAFAKIRRQDAEKLKKRAMKMANKMNRHIHEKVFAHKRKHHIEGRFKRDREGNVMAPKHLYPIHTQKKNGHQHQFRNKELKHRTISKKNKVHKITKRKKDDKNHQKKTSLPSK